MEIYVYRVDQYEDDQDAEKCGALRMIKVRFSELSAIDILAAIQEIADTFSGDWKEDLRFTLKQPSPEHPFPPMLLSHTQHRMYRNLTFDQLSGTLLELLNGVDKRVRKLQL